MDSKGTHTHTHTRTHTHTQKLWLKNTRIYKTEKAYILIDVAIPADRNVTQKKAVKEVKYKTSCREIQWMWNMNAR